MTTLPYQTHSATSAEAAERAEPRAGTARAEVLALIRSAGPLGLTDDDIERFSGMNPSTIRPRRGELLRAGLIEDSGKTRLTQSMSKATVWRAVPAKEPAPCGTCGGSGQVGAPCPDGPRVIDGVLVSCAVMHSRPCPLCRPGGAA